MAKKKKGAAALMREDLLWAYQNFHLRPGEQSSPPRPEAITMLMWATENTNAFMQKLMAIKDEDEKEIADDAKDDKLDDLMKELISGWEGKKKR